MENAIHTMSHLFAQLGQPSDAPDIAAFIARHGPLPGDMRLHEATFWTRAQASFLCEAIGDDADWSAVTDDLNTLLHGVRH